MASFPSQNAASAGATCTVSSGTRQSFPDLPYTAVSPFLFKF